MKYLSMYKSEYCYYLVYKLNNYHKLWIVNVDYKPDHFVEFIKKVKSKQEKYYLIRKKVYNLDEEIKNFKRFTVFSKEKDCEIIKESGTNFIFKNIK